MEHYVIVAIPGVRQVRCKVITLKRNGPGAATITIKSDAPLPIGVHEAQYVTPSRFARGTFKVSKYGGSPDGLWQLSGIFIGKIGD